MYPARFLWFASLVAAASIAHSTADAQTLSRSASHPNRVAAYTVTVTSIATPRFKVRAELSLTDDTLRMARSWPCDVEALCSRGWPLLIDDLRVTDTLGRDLRTDTIGASGWVVRDHYGGRLILKYSVNYDLLAKNNWPAPRETAFSDGSTLFTVGRPIFIGTRGEGPIEILFTLPPSAHVVAPWPRDTGHVSAFIVPSFDALVDNGLVIRNQPAAPITADRFALQLVLFGGWHQQRELVTRLMHAHLVTFTRLLGFDEDGAYLAVFLEDPDMGGESFLSTHVLSASPDSALVRWGRLIAHEIFHYWNGQRLRGVDYTTSQWFQEGVSEYYAILSMARNDFITPATALDELSRHLRAHRGFGRSLAASGNRKGRSFYGSATLAAFVIDVMIRDATGTRHSLDDLMREMWARFGRADRPYGQAELLEMAGATAGVDLRPFFQTHIEGDVPLPMNEVLPAIGLKLGRNAQGEEIITEDVDAPGDLRARWRALIAGRD